jgi:hypothetical protein
VAALWSSPLPNQDPKQPAESLHGGTLLVKMTRQVVAEPAILKPKKVALVIPSADGN